MPTHRVARPMGRGARLLSAVVLAVSCVVAASSSALASPVPVSPDPARDAEILSREPRSPNPYLAFLPSDVEPDYEWWNAWLRAESRRRQAEREDPARLQNFFEIEPNNSIADPDFLPGFGTGSGDDPTANVDGTGSFVNDVDVFSVDLEAGDVLGVAVILGAAFEVAIIDPSGTIRMASRSDATGIFPPTSPLPSGSISAAFVANSTGRYFVGVIPFTATAYRLRVQASRPATELNGARQILFLDFDGATVNPALFGGPPGNVALSPLSSFLSRWGLSAGQESALIDGIIANVRENLVQSLAANGNNPFLDVEILNSRDHADPFGQPNVSRLIVGGTQAQLGIDTIGIAQSIDPGNFGVEETAVTLLDVLSGPGGDTLNQFPIAAGSSKLALVARGVGNITTHEAGHFLGNYHTDQFNGTPNLQDQGGNLPGTLGVGNDGIFGSGDDVDVDFVQDVFVPSEGFQGLEDTLNQTAFALTGPTIFENGFENGFSGWSDVVP